MKTDATKKLPGEGFKRAWPPLIKMDEAGKNISISCLEMPVTSFAKKFKLPLSA